MGDALNDQWEVFERQYQYARTQREQRQQVAFAAPTTGDSKPTQYEHTKDISERSNGWKNDVDARLQKMQDLRRVEQQEADTTAMNAGLEMPSEEESKRYLEGQAYMGPITGWHHHQADRQSRFSIAELAESNGAVVSASRSLEPETMLEKGVPIHERLYREAQEKRTDKERESEPALVDPDTGR